jgi:hypothetical protein
MSELELGDLRRRLHGMSESEFLRFGSLLGIPLICDSTSMIDPVRLSRWNLMELKEAREE